MKTGLTLGKYAHLHRGHQLVLETAFSVVDRMIVLIYDAPETISCPLPVRAGWIRKLYPQVEVFEAWDGPMEVGDAPAIMRMHEDYLRKVLQGRRVTHFFSSEFYGEHVSRALEAMDCRTDPDRVRVPVSATAIREDPYAYRRFLSPTVYRDLILKAVFLGAPSTGKSTLAERLAKKYQTAWMPEYGREYWEKHQQDRRLSLDQLLEIAEAHLVRENERVMESNRFLFTDTDATTTFMFSLHYHGNAHPRLAELAAETRNRYDLFFLCEDDIPYDNTWDRSGEVRRAVFQKQTRADLLCRRIPFLSLKGSLEQRLQTVSAILRRCAPWDSVADHLHHRAIEGSEFQGSRE